jgi:hypothetical protein
VWGDVQSRDDAIVMTVTQLRHVLRKYPFPALDDEGREIEVEAPEVPESADAQSGNTDPVDTSDDEAGPDTETDSTNHLIHWEHGGRTDTGLVSFNPPRTYYDDLRKRMRTDSDDLAKIQPSGLR